MLPFVVIAGLLIQVLFPHLFPVRESRSFFVGLPFSQVADTIRALGDGIRTITGDHLQVRTGSNLYWWYLRWKRSDLLPMRTDIWLGDEPFGTNVLIVTTALDWGFWREARERYHQIFAAMFDTIEGAFSGLVAWSPDSPSPDATSPNSP